MTQTILIVQENGRHDKNRKFRECFSLQRAFQTYGLQVVVWGLGHENYARPFEEVASSSDAILVMENYDGSGWVPDLSGYSQPKLFWSIDAHIRFAEHARFALKNKIDLVFSSTEHFVPQFQAAGLSSMWLPNAYDHFLVDHLIASKKQVPYGFCGNTANRGEWITHLKARWGMRHDEMVIGDDMVATINSYLIHVNKNFSTDINYRTFETLGCKTCLVTNYTPGLEKLFDLDSHLVVYQDMNDLDVKLSALSQKPELCFEYAQRGYDHVRANHTYVHRAGAILSSLGWTRPTREDVLRAIPNAGENARTLIEGVPCWLPYQSVRMNDGFVLPGIRDYSSRLADFEWAKQDFRGKTVLDIGCNMGMLCIEAKRAGARRVVGIDYDPKYVEFARTLAAHLGLDIEYHQLDLNSFDFKDFGRFFGQENFDIAFCCSMIENLNDPVNFSRNLNSRIAETYYLEGHKADTNADFMRYRAYLTECMDFSSIDFLGYTDSGLNSPEGQGGKKRPTFRAGK